MLSAERELHACGFLGQRQLTRIGNRRRVLRMCELATVVERSKVRVARETDFRIFFAAANSLASLAIHSPLIGFGLCRTFKMSHGRSGPLALAPGSASDLDNLLWEILLECRTAKLSEDKSAY